MAEKIVGEYDIKVDGALKSLDDLTNKVIGVGRASSKSSKSIEDGFNDGANSAKRFQRELDKQPKTIAELELKLRNLKELLRDDARIGTKAFKDVSKEVKKTQSDIDRLNGKVDKTSSSYSSMAKNMSSQFKKIGMAIGLAFSVDQIARFGKESIKVAAEAEGITSAFNKLNQSSLLDDLRRATRGTVTDLELMRNAVKAENFSVELSQLPILFEFATKRSIETGRSVDDLTERIIRGIGTKSSKVLDDLGISLVDIQEELKTTTNYAEAIGNIAAREIVKMGDVQILRLLK